MTGPAKPRTRAGSYNTFVRRYGPIDPPSGEIMWRWDELPKDVDEHLVWTIVEGDTGRLYLVPGYATVNYMGRMLCERPWTDAELYSPGYVW